MSNMNEFVLTTVLVCLVISNNVRCRSFSEIEADTFAPDLPEIDQLSSSILTSDDERTNIQPNQFDDDILDARNNFEVCVKSQIDFTELMKEVVEAKPKGVVYMVYKKYCKKAPQLNECLLNYSSAIDKSGDDGKKETRKILLNVTDALLSFMCYDEGRPLEIFYTEGGPLCLEDKHEAITQCFNATFSKYTPNGKPCSFNMTAFKFEENQCRSIFNLQACVLDKLEQCLEPTTANFAESLFNILRKSTPCSKFRND